MTLEIVCNNIARDIVYGFELTEKEAAEFDYLDNINDSSFFRYKGRVYDLGEFMVCEKGGKLETSGWHGYSSDSYFSGILVKYTDDYERVIVARYLC